MSYGNLNASSGRGKLDGGSERDSHRTAISAISQRQDTDGGCWAVQEGSIVSAMSMGDRVSLVR